MHVSDDTAVTVGSEFSFEYGYIGTIQVPIYYTHTTSQIGIRFSRVRVCVCTIIIITGYISKANKQGHIMPDIFAVQLRNSDYCYYYSYTRTVA